MDELEELITRLTVLRSSGKLVLGEIETVNDAIIVLEELQSLKKSGMDNFTKTEV